MTGTNSDRLRLLVPVAGIYRLQLEPIAPGFKFLATTQNFSQAKQKKARPSQTRPFKSNHHYQLPVLPACNPGRRHFGVSGFSSLQ